jgi:hypothetical protein
MTLSFSCKARSFKLKDNDVQEVVDQNSKKLVKLKISIQTIIQSKSNNENKIDMMGSFRLLGVTTIKFFD